MTERPKCFVIMPITTPKSHLVRYANNKNHFKNILKGLITPAVERAEYQVIPPEPEGSDIIQGSIIRNLHECEMVVCDMSILNANVFFELGIRTALDKPVALIKDAYDKSPFDTSPVKYHKYSHAPSWTDNEQQIQLLSDHIKKTAGLGDSNPLWDHFGLSSQDAGTLQREWSSKKLLSYLVQQVAELKTNMPFQIDSDTLIPERGVWSPSFAYFRENEGEMADELINLQLVSFEESTYEYDLGGHIEITFNFMVNLTGVPGGSLLQMSGLPLPISSIMQRSSINQNGLNTTQNLFLSPDSIGKPSFFLAVESEGVLKKYVTTGAETTVTIAGSIAFQTQR